MQLCYIAYVLDGPSNISMLREENKLRCEALCNPECDYMWINETTGHSITLGSEYYIPPDQILRDVLCRAENEISSSNVSVESIIQSDKANSTLWQGNCSIVPLNAVILCSCVLHIIIHTR